MSFILKIVQGPNVGAEIALIEGVNVKLGKSDECDIVLSDQSLPDVACELEPGTERVTLLLPGGAQQRLEPFHVKVFETTAIAIGPADGPWGALVWPDPEAEKDEAEEEPQEPVPAEPVPMTPARKHQAFLLVLLIVFVVLEMVLWFFWPQINGFICSARAWSRDKIDEWSGRKELEAAAEPVIKMDLDTIAKNNELVVERQSEDKVLLKGNLKTRAERLLVTANAYEAQPGVVLDLSDDETLKVSSDELLNMLTEGTLQVESVSNRQLALKGRVDDLDKLKAVLKALNADVPHLEKVDCSQVAIGAKGVEEDETPVVAEDLPVAAITPGVTAATTPVAMAGSAVPADSPAPATSEGKTVENAPLNGIIDIQKGNVEQVLTAKGKVVPAKVKISDAQQEKAMLSQLPVVGVMTLPYPCLVLKNGSRILEGAEINGFTVLKINDDVILLTKGERTYEWRP